MMVLFADRWSLHRGALVSLKWPMEQTTVVTIDRWSLYRGAVVSLRWPMEQPTVVTIDRWSLSSKVQLISQITILHIEQIHYKLQLYSK